MPCRAANWRARSGARAATASTVASGTRCAGRTSAIGAMCAAPRMPRRSGSAGTLREPQEPGRVPARHQVDRRRGQDTAEHLLSEEAHAVGGVGTLVLAEVGRHDRALRADLYHIARVNVMGSSV